MRGTLIYNILLDFCPRAKRAGKARCAVDQIDRAFHFWNARLLLLAPGVQPLPLATGAV